MDTTGAGDAFNGALSFALSKDYSYRDSLVFANKVGGISTTKLGAANAMPTIKKWRIINDLFSIIKQIQENDIQKLWKQRS